MVGRGAVRGERRLRLFTPRTPCPEVMLRIIRAPGGMSRCHLANYWKGGVQKGWEVDEEREGSTTKPEPLTGIDNGEG